MQGMGILEKELLVVMAIYEFKCCGITNQLVQSITMPLVHPKCSICNGDMARIYSPVGVSFKANGFYLKDNKSA